MSTQWKYYLLNIAALVLAACSSPADREPKTLPIVELEAGMTTISAKAPFRDNLALIRMINNAMEAAADAKGEDSVTLLGTVDSMGKVHAPLKLKNIYFFPETSDTALVKDLVQASTFNLRRDTLFSHGIDFRKDFAFVIVHPPKPGGDLHVNSLSIIDSTGDRLILSLSDFAVPDEDSIVNAYWHTSIYKIHRSGYKRLGVVYQADTTFFSLKE